MEPLSNVGLGIIFAAGHDVGLRRQPRFLNPGEPGSEASLSWLAGRMGRGASCRG
jgi:hypothetical protein